MTFETLFQFVRRRRLRTRARRDHDVDAGQFPLPLSEAFANQPPQPVARHRVADRACTDRHAEPYDARFVRVERDTEKGIARPPAILIDIVEVRGRADSLAGSEGQTPDRGSVRESRSYGIKRLRPLARRRARTSLPPLLAMRARNPWVRARWILLG